MIHQPYFDLEKKTMREKKKVANLPTLWQINKKL